MHSLGLLRTPEEKHAPAVIKRRDELLAQAKEPARDGLRLLARRSSGALRAHHRQPAAPRRNARPSRPASPDRRTESARRAARSTKRLSWLGPAEKVHVAGDPRLLERLAELPAN